jgi:tetratricopeptide (TPR) repeat protein
VQRFTTAKNILSLIFGYAGLDPSDSQIPRAWGRIGDFYYQLAGARDERDGEAKTQDYNLAYEHYHKAQQSPVADIATIAQATVGLGKVRRSQANLAANLEQKAGYLGESLNYYLDVVYAPADERPDAMLLHMAGRLAGELCEEQKRYRQAIEVYRRVADLIPALRLAMEKRVESAREKESLQRP